MQNVIHTACVEGSEVIEIKVETDIHPGLPVFTVIGLPDKRIEEARERVRAAIKASGFPFPLGRITINLAPSSVRKRGTGFDLAIALGILSASGSIPSAPRCWFVGELGLAGDVRPYAHLASVLAAAKERGVPVIIPSEQRAIASLVPGCRVFTVSSLRSAIVKPSWETSPPWTPQRLMRSEYLIDRIRGQEQGKRALLISLAGRHPLLLTGPPGMGKTLLAEAARELLPPPDIEATLEAAKLHAFAEEPVPNKGEAPFRSPRHTASRAALIGGGVPLRPGEASLAHGGILFLDELPLFGRECLEALREVMQSGTAVHNRKGRSHSFPAGCLVIAARNPCACGRANVEGQECLCTGAERAKYGLRVSEPLLDRFELFCDVPAMSSSEWEKGGEPLGAQFAGIIEKTRGSRSQIDWSPAAVSAMRAAADSFHLSGRARKAVEGVAETIARIEGHDVVAETDLGEALQFRRRGR